MGDRYCVQESVNNSGESDALLGPSYVQVDQSYVVSRTENHGELDKETRLMKL